MQTFPTTWVRDGAALIPDLSHVTVPAGQVIRASSVNLPAEHEPAAGDVVHVAVEFANAPSPSKSVPPDPLSYRASRVADYPPIGDQLDALWKMLSPPPGSDAEAIKAAIAGVKARHPKPTA